MNKFILQTSYETSRESSALHYEQIDHPEDYHVIYNMHNPKDIDGVPLGSVAFVEMKLGKQTPDYYPEWTKSAWHREIGIDNVTGDKVFIKPSDTYKRFDAFKTYKFLTETINKYEPVIASGVVCFVDEWRYYVANGKILCSWWYDGSDVTCEIDPNGPSELPFDIPEDFCGAIDMGYLDTGEFALVEVQHPYAIGWYGDHNDDKNYIKFLAEGWEYLTK